jgi:two-component system nitrate/nitrite response regulator NarP
VVFTGAPIGEVLLALDLDVQGLVSKDKTKDFLARCIQFVHAGGKWLDHDLSDKSMALLLAQKREKAQASQLLTPREMTVARLVTEGLPNKRIATQLAISEGTAKLHLHHIYQKLSCSGRMSLQRCMQEQGVG